MTAHLTLVSNRPQTTKTMSSREIAELTGKQHRAVLADIRKMLAELEIGEQSFLRSYQSAQNKSLPEFHLPHDLTMTLVSGYSVAMRHRIVTRWQELEAQQQQPAFRIPQTMSEALRLAADQQETIEQQQRQLVQQAPKVEFVDRYVETDGTVSFRELCKMLPANEARVREFLIAEKIMYKAHGKMMPRKEHVLAGRFAVRAGQSDHGYAFTQSRFTTKGVTWITAEWAKYSMQQERLAA